MKKFIYILFIWSTYFAFGQIDQSKEKSKILSPKIGTSATINVKIPVSLEFNENYNGFKSAKQKQDKQRQKQRDEEKENNKGIITKSIMREKRFKKHMEGLFMKFPQIDMDLGSFHTSSKNIHIVSYDFGRFDGDKVQISVNGKRIHNNYTLTPRRKILSVPLSIGINKIEVTALNEGELSPNTGYFAFYGDKKYLIKEGEWMLAEGAKVIAIVVRDEK